MLGNQDKHSCLLVINQSQARAVKQILEWSRFEKGAVRMKGQKEEKSYNQENSPLFPLSVSYTWAVKRKLPNKSLA